MYNRYTNVLTEQEQKICLSILDEPSWAFTGHSNLTEKDFTFWYKDLSENYFLNTICFNKIQNLIGKNFIIKRLYANGQTFGQSGSLHLDSTEKNNFTFLYYANLTWDITWGGETVFYKDSNNVETALFIPNSGILFDGNILHAGLEPSRHFKGLRMTIAYKLEKI